MSFTSYLVNMGIDAELGIVGLLGLLSAVAMLIEGNMLLTVVFLVVGALPLLYSRYRARELGIRY
jgi:hypothetical protein